MVRDDSQIQHPIHSLQDAEWLLAPSSGRAQNQVAGETVRSSQPAAGWGPAKRLVLAVQRGISSCLRKSIYAAI